MYDLLLKGGEVIDPAQNIHQVMDVAIKDGRIASLREGLSGSEAKQVINVAGKIVVPGLIDLHTHVYPGANIFGLDADSLSAQSGVTTYVDAGSAGPVNFTAFKEHVIDRSKARILAFLNIAWAGLSCAIYRPQDMVILGELNELRYAVISAVVETAQAYPDLILGVKVRAGLDPCGTQGIKPVQLALQAADELGKPIMAHISFPPPTRRELLPLLRKGDILTHVFRGRPNSPLDGRENVLPEMVDARKRGVIMDIGHGGGSFSFEVARRMLEAGFPPDVISSDIHALCTDVAVDLPTTMSKMLNLGMSLDEVIEATTWAPAKIVGKQDELGSLKEGTTADLAVFEIEKGKFEFRDGFGSTIMGKRRFSHVLTILNGEVIKHSTRK